MVGFLEEDRDIVASHEDTVQNWYKDKNPRSSLKLIYFGRFAHSLHTGIRLQQERLSDQSIQIFNPGTYLIVRTKFQ